MLGQTLPRLSLSGIALLCADDAPPLRMFFLEFRAEVNREETTVMGLSSSEDRMIVAGVVLT